jgi:hypothetical protein
MLDCVCELIRTRSGIEKDEDKTHSLVIWPSIPYENITFNAIDRSSNEKSGKRQPGESRQQQGESRKEWRAPAVALLVALTQFYTLEMKITFQVLF